MTHAARLKWCPNGCGKKCKRTEYYPMLSEKAKYRCTKCKCKFNKTQLETINNMR